MVAQNAHFNLPSRTLDSQRRSSLAENSADLLPWADPYIARLVRSLQAEVRRERAARARLKRMHEQAADEFSPYGVDQPHWPLLEE